jgi:2-polyprenyl-3-methyl-5-hydroxy-6-metoxy-1,4-benzoquinol methylase
VLNQLASRGVGLSILDLGCGNGAATARIAAQGHRVVGVDISRDGIEIARVTHPQVRFEIGSIYDPELESLVSEPVDVVIALEVVEHMLYPRLLFETSHRMLKNGGALIVSTPYHGYLKNLVLSILNGWDRHFGVAVDGGHIKFFSKTTLGQMAAAAGFRNPQCIGAGRIPWLWKSVIMVGEK